MEVFLSFDRTHLPIIGGKTNQLIVCGLNLIKECITMIPR